MKKGTHIKFKITQIEDCVVFKITKISKELLDFVPIEDISYKLLATSIVDVVIRQNYSYPIIDGVTINISANKINSNAIKQFKTMQEASEFVKRLKFIEYMLNMICNVDLKDILSHEPKYLDISIENKENLVLYKVSSLADIKKFICGSFAICKDTSVPFGLMRTANPYNKNEKNMLALNVPYEPSNSDILYAFHNNDRTEHIISLEIKSLIYFYDMYIDELEKFNK